MSARLEERFAKLQNKIELIQATNDKIKGLSMELARKEKEVLEQNEFINSVLNTTPDIIYVYNVKERKFVFINQRISDILGHSNEFILNIGNNAKKSLLHPDDVEIYLSTITKRYQYLVDGEVLEYEFRLKHVNSNFIWCKFRETIFSRDWDGSPKEVVGVLTDVSQLKEANLRNHMQLAALNNAIHIILITDTNGTIIFVNNVFTEAYGYKPEEIIGKNPNILKSGEHSDAFYKEMWQTILAGSRWDGIIINKKKDGSIIQERTTITPVLNGKINYFVAIKEII